MLAGTFGRDTIATRGFNDVATGPWLELNRLGWIRPSWYPGPPKLDLNNAVPIGPGPSRLDLYRLGCFCAIQTKFWSWRVPAALAGTGSLSNPTVPRLTVLRTYLCPSPSSTHLRTNTGNCSPIWTTHKIIFLVGFALPGAPNWWPRGVPRRGCLPKRLRKTLTPPPLRR